MYNHNTRYKKKFVYAMLQQNNTPQKKPLKKILKSAIPQKPPVKLLL